MDKEDLIIRLLEEMRSEMNRRFDETNKRIDDSNKRIDDSNKRTDEIKDELREIKQDLRLDSRKLEQVYEAREHVKVSFGWQWGMVSLFIAIVAAGITKIFS